MRSALIAAACLAVLSVLPARADDRSTSRRVSPAAEFEAPYDIRILSGGDIIEISGTFSRAMPQNFYAALARAPNVRTIGFDSPGGHVQPALQIAAIIRSRGYDTYVPRYLCAAIPTCRDSAPRPAPWRSWPVKAVSWRPGRSLVFTRRT